MKTPAGWVVAEGHRDRFPPGVPPLARDPRSGDGGGEARARPRRRRLGRAKQLADEAKGGNLEAAAKKAGATDGETPRFSRAKPAEKLPGDAQLAALQTPAGR